jgi:hypothetical protein
VDTWHGILMSAIGSLSTVVGVLWRQNVRLRKQLDDLHEEHKDDIRVLTHETIELARAATYAPPLKPSVSPRCD